MLSLLVLEFILFFNLLLFAYSFFRVKNSGQKVDFLIGWGFEDGIFVWEDAVIISFYNIITTLLALLLHDLRWAAAAYLVFWFVRGLGETIYWFLHQFVIKKQYPHNRVVLAVSFWQKLFGNISEQKFYILTQVSSEMAAAISLFLLLMLLAYWNNLGIYRWL